MGVWGNLAAVVTATGFGWGPRDDGILLVRASARTGLVIAVVCRVDVQVAFCVTMCLQRH